MSNQTTSSSSTPARNAAVAATAPTAPPTTAIPLGSIQGAQSSSNPARTTQITTAHPVPAQGTQTSSSPVRTTQAAYVHQLQRSRLSTRMKAYISSNRLGLGVSVIVFIIGTVSLVAQLKSNMLAREANMATKEGNRIAEKSWWLQVWEDCHDRADLKYS